MSSSLPTTDELEFQLVAGIASAPYQVEARHLAAALLTLSRKNANGHAGVKLMMEEVFLIDTTLTDRTHP